MGGSHIIGLLGAINVVRKKRVNVLDQAARASIIDYLRNNECASITELCKSLELSWGVAQHHLYVLRKAGLVYREVHGRTSLFFLKDQKIGRARILALLRSPRAREIVTAVSQQPGVRQKELLEFLNLSRKVFRHHVDLLVAAGLLHESRGGARRVYQPTELTRKGVDHLVPQRPPSQPGGPQGP